MIRVKWTTSAEADLAAIDDYMSMHTTNRAGDILDTIEAAGVFLSERPKAGPPLDSGTERKWRVGGTPYILIYRIEHDQLSVLRVHHYRTDWRQMQ